MPATPGPYPLNGVEMPTWLLRFDAHGACTSPATRALLLQQLRDDPPSDLIVFSHGWNNDAQDAMQMYGTFLRNFDAFAAARPAGRPFKPLFLGVLRPSIWLSFERGPEIAAAGSDPGYPGRQRLLGAPRPLRAFIGHVEPTFDWTLRDPRTGQPLAHSLLAALYDRLYADCQRRPIGWAMDEVFRDVGVLLAEGRDALAAIRAHQPRTLGKALCYQIAAMDRQHTVILGDPAVALPGLRAAPPHAAAGR